MHIQADRVRWHGWRLDPMLLDLAPRVNAGIVTIDILGPMPGALATN